MAPSDRSWPRNSPRLQRYRTEIVVALALTIAALAVIIGSMAF